MNGKERVVKALEFSGPDRVPIMHHTLPGAWIKYGEKLRSLYRRYPADIVSLAFSPSDEYGPMIGDGVRDEWGAVWVRLGDSHKGQVVEHPLEDWHSFNAYRFPEPANTDEYESVKERVETEGHEQYVLVDGGTLFQRMFYLRGLERLLVDLVKGDERVFLLRDRILQHILGRIKCWLETGAVDGINIRDDWGAQDRLLVSPELWREVFKPCYRKICEAIHRGGAKAHMHTDGYTQLIVPELIDAGFDELNLQLSVFDLNKLAPLVSKRVCIRTDIDRQHLLPRGTPSEIKQYVRRIIRLFGQANGGLIGCGEMADDIPLANAEAMLEAFCTIG